MDKRTITLDDLRRAQLVLDIRERLIFRLNGCEGMGPGESVGLQLGDIRDGLMHIQRAIYRGVVDTPKGRRTQSVSRSRRIIPLIRCHAHDSELVP